MTYNKRKRKPRHGQLFQAFCYVRFTLSACLTVFINICDPEVQSIPNISVFRYCEPSPVGLLVESFIWVADVSDYRFILSYGLKLAVYHVDYKQIDIVIVQFLVLPSIRRVPSIRRISGKSTCSLIGSSSYFIIFPWFPSSWFLTGDIMASQHCVRYVLDAWYWLARGDEFHNVRK